MNFTKYSRNKNNIVIKNEKVKAQNETVEIEPRDADTWNGKGNAFYDLGKYEDAIKAFEKAIEIDQKYKKAWYNKGLSSQTQADVKRQ